MNFEAPPGDVRLQVLTDPRGRPERRAARERRVVDAAPRDERVGQRAGDRRVGIEAVVEERAEVVDLDLAAGLGGERLRLLDADGGPAPA